MTDEQVEAAHASVVASGCVCKRCIRAALAAEVLFTIAVATLLGVYVWHMTSPPRAAVEPAVAPGEPEPRACGEFCP